MKSLEHEEQVNLMQWWSLQCRRFGVAEQCLFAIPNGGQRNIITAKRMKDEGVRSGIPDLFLAVPRGKFHGLFIEMKKPKGGVVSDNQKACMEILSTNGYYVAVCHGFIEAKTAITSYLDSCLVDKKGTPL